MNPLLAFSISTGIIVLIGISIILVKLLKSKKERHDENLKIAFALRLIEQDGGISFLRQSNVRRVSAYEFKVQTQLGDGAESTVYPDGMQNISVSVFRRFDEVMCFVTLAALIGDGEPRFSMQFDLPEDYDASNVYPRLTAADIATAKNEHALRARALGLLGSIDSILRDRAKA